MYKNDNSRNVASFIKRRKGNLIKVFHSKCCLCGFDKFQEALEFHHVNPDEKEFGVCDSNAVTKALEKQLNEMKKCILVCANCHRGIHSGYYEIPNNWKDYYDEEIAQQLIDDLPKNQLNKKIQQSNNFCLICGKPILSSMTYCSLECLHKAQQRCDRPSREELKQLIREQPFTKIAAMYGVTDNSIRKWCDSMNLPRRKTEIQKYSDNEWEKI